MTSRPIPDQDLLAYAAGEMQGEAARRLEARLETDREAARVVALYRFAARTTAADDSTAPPRETVARAKAIFTRRPAAPRPSLIERIEAIVAHLVFDSRLQPVAVRSGDAGTRFQLAFETDAVEIDLQAERLDGAADEAAGDRWRLIGQVSTAEDPAVVDVIVTRPGQAAATARARADERGVFTMDVAPGRYDISLQLPTERIVLPAVEVA